MKKSLLLVLLFLHWAYSTGFAQSSNGLGARKVQDYFQDVESKSYYQQERIRSMKGEMNEYSERLHSLQDKFQQIFYGRSADELHQSPFGEKEKISYPKRKYREPMPEVESIVPSTKRASSFQSRSNQLAFRVDEPKATPPEEEQGLRGSESPSNTVEEGRKDDLNENKWDEPASHESVGGSNFGGYLIIRPSVIFPYKKQTSHQNPSKSKHRVYEEGMAITLSAGYKWKSWKLGGGILYRQNKYDSESFETVDGVNKKSFADGSKSKSIAGFIEGGYTHSFNHFFGIYGNIGLGYGVSVVEDFAPALSAGADRARLDPFFLATLGLGATWTPIDNFALSLGYRYLYEDEVPAHAIEVGIEGRF